ncbi:MAG TPA: XdhC family protein [Gaiellaceae bacterium]|nr:XdhC family protein [Gaiellaceae bacterium]
MKIYDRLRLAIEREERAVLLTIVEGEPLGAKTLVVGGEVVGEGPLQLADGARTGLVEHEGRKVFVEVFGPPPKLVVLGAVDVAESLCALAGPLGWRTVVADTRAALATRERIPSADELLVGWPDEVLERIGLDEDSAVVVLTHDEKLDTPALVTALPSPAFYVGALGSRRAQAARRERLLEAGLDEDDLDRLSGPSGLDLGASTPPETALSILAEAVAVRAGRTGGRLAESSGRIHVEG